MMFPKPKKPASLSAKEFRKAWKSTYGRKGGKFGIQRVEDKDGRRYASGLEREYFQELLLREKAGEIRDLEREPQIYFEINGVRITGYKPDFSFFEIKLGARVWEETKGEATDKTEGWRIRQNLWRAIGPGLLRVIKGDKNGWACVRVIHPQAMKEGVPK